MSEYKIVCESFSINFTEFETIFQKDNKEFIIWDTDSNGLIDGLELFSGLILISDCSVDEKLKCTSKYFFKNSLISFKNYLEIQIKLIYFNNKKLII